MFIFTLFFFALGIGFCLLAKKYSKLHIDNAISFEINPLEIFSIIITILLAIYVTRTLSKKNDLEKNEKDLCIGHLSELNNTINLKVNNILKECLFDTPETRSTMKVLRMKTNSITELIQSHLNFNDESSKNNTKLNDKVNEIWTLLTDVPRKPDKSVNESTADNMEVLRLEKINNVEKCLIKIDEIIFKLILNINNM